MLENIWSKILNNLIKGKKYDWELVIGLEIHAQVKSKSKLFSSSPTKFGSKPNSQVSLVDAAMPGMLPVINEFYIKQAMIKIHNTIFKMDLRSRMILQVHDELIFDMHNEEKPLAVPVSNIFIF